MNPDDPLVQALPPATDYLTYCTILEYQLTPDRLSLLHQLLQDERLTTNIGWDLVKLLLPMLPASTECLQDVARLGNPREVILRVSDALLQLSSEIDNFEPGKEEEVPSEGPKLPSEGFKPLPAHILQFNCLVAMLSVLHSRIQTKSPSRFIATSLHATLEAYTSLPCDETTLALLEFLRDLSPNKRPAPAPRAPSESSVLRVAEKSAPDPEAEVASPSPAAENETALVHKFLQFALLELLKSYLLHFSSPTDPGMSWAVRMQEHLHPSLRMPGQSQTEAYSSTKELRERDMIMGKIVALSRDFGINNSDLLTIVTMPAGMHMRPIDFEDPPKSPDVIPLERHGCLLLLAARAAGAIMFARGHSMPDIPIFPHLYKIVSSFLGETHNLDEVAYGEPQALLDALVALTIHSMQRSTAVPADEIGFKRFVIALTACTARESHAIVRQIPATIVRSHPSQMARFKLIHSTLANDRLGPAWESAISWLKEEIIHADSAGTIFRDRTHSDAPVSAHTIFHDPVYFWAMVPPLFHSVKTVTAEGLVGSWMHLVETQGSAVHAGLNLYYLLLSSESFRNRLHLEKTVPFFRSQVLNPLRKLFRDFEADLPSNGGDGLIQSAVGEEMCAIGNVRTVGVISLTLDQIEETLDDLFGTDDSDLKGYSEDEEARASEIRRKVEEFEREYNNPVVHSSDPEPES